MSNTTITPGAGAVAVAGVAPALTFATNWGGATPAGQTDANSGIVKIVTWKNIPLTAAGPPAIGPPIGYNFGGWAKFYATATGTFGAAGSVQLEGSNDGVNWFKLSAAALTSAGAFGSLASTEQPLYIRPNATAGDNTTSLTVVAVVEDTV